MLRELLNRYLLDVNRLLIRQLILKEKCPQIKKLFDTDPTFKRIAKIMVLIQFACCITFVVTTLPWSLVIDLANIFGGTISHLHFYTRY